MSAKRFDELREHVLKLAHLGASHSELTELKRCMRQLEITGKSYVKVDNGTPVIVSSEPDFDVKKLDPVRYIQKGDERGLRTIRKRIHKLSMCL